MPRRRGTVGLGRGPREMKVFQSFRGDKGQRKGKKEEEKRACRRIPRCGLFHHPREEEKRREVVTGNVYSAYTQAPRRTSRLWHTVDISKYLLSAAGLSLSLSHPLDSPSLVLSTNFSSPLLRVQSRPYSFYPPFNIHARNVLASPLFFGSNPIVEIRRDLSPPFPFAISTRGFFKLRPLFYADNFSPHCRRSDRELFNLLFSVADRLVPFFLFFCRHGGMRSHVHGARLNTVSSRPAELRFQPALIQLRLVVIREGIATVFRAYVVSLSYTSPIDINKL